MTNRSARTRETESLKDRNREQNNDLFEKVGESKKDSPRFYPVQP
jgi:hypothetical protein